MSIEYNIANELQLLWASLMTLWSGIDITQYLAAWQAGLNAQSIWAVILRGILIGGLPGLVTGAIALPLFGASDLIYKFALGAGLGGVGAIIYEGIRVSDILQSPLDFFSTDVSGAGAALGAILYAGLIGIALGGLVIVLIYETVKALSGAAAGFLAGSLTGLVIYFINTQSGLLIDPRVQTLVVGGVVFTVAAFFLSHGE